MINTNLEDRLAIFDVDNTLLDSSLKLSYDVVNALAGCGVQIRPEEVKGDWYALAQSYGVSKDQFSAEFNKRKSWERSLLDGEVPIFPETIACLETLRQKGVRMAVLSRSIPEYTDQKLKFYGLDKYFDGVVNVDPKAESKVEGALELVRELDTSKFSRIYCIGDKEEDVSVTKEISKEYGLNSHGIYVNRQGGKLEGYASVRSLSEVPGLIG